MICPHCGGKVEDVREKLRRERREQGRCIVCGDPSLHLRCPSCAEDHNARRRKTTKAVPDPEQE